MPTIQAHVSTADLLKAVEEMSLPELNGFVSDVLNLRARRAERIVAPGGCGGLQDRLGDVRRVPDCPGPLAGTAQGAGGVPVRGSRGILKTKAPGSS